MRVKEELAALRPAAPAERRALLAALLRFAATLHIGTLGPRYTLVLATGSGGVTRLAFWLLQGHPPTGSGPTSGSARPGPCPAGPLRAGPGRPGGSGC